MDASPCVLVKVNVRFIVSMLSLQHTCSQLKNGFLICQDFTLKEKREKRSKIRGQGERGRRGEERRECKINKHFLLILHLKTNLSEIKHSIT